VLIVFDTVFERQKHNHDWSRCPTNYNLLETCWYELLTGKMTVSLSARLWISWVAFSPFRFLSNHHASLFLSLETNRPQCTQYVSRAAATVRGAVKEPLKNKLQQQQIFTYKAAKWEGGIAGDKAEITALNLAGKA
jgi:hypothetical protein